MSCMMAVSGGDLLGDDGVWMAWKRLKKKKKERKRGEKAAELCIIRVSCRARCFEVYLLIVD